MNYEQNKRFTVRIIVSDQGTPALTDTLTYNIKVIDVNDSPTLVSQSGITYTIAENSLTNADVSNPLVGDDEDVGSKLTFTIENGEPGDDWLYCKSVLPLYLHCSSLLTHPISL